MNKIRKNRVLLTKSTALTALLLLLTQFLSAASTEAPERGYISNKSYSVSGIESISTQSGNLMFNIPVGSLPMGRGGLTDGITLSYNSKLWDVQHSQTADRHGNDVDCTTIEKSIEGGWRYGYKFYITGEIAENNRTRTMLVTADGARHLLLHGNGTSGDGDQTGATDLSFDGTYGSSSPTTPGQIIRWFTVDSTFLRVEVLTDNDTDWTNNLWTVYLPDGGRIVNNPSAGVAQRRYDRNGNYVDIIETSADSNYSGRRTTTLKDNFDRKVVLEYNTGASGVDQDTIHSPGVGGTDLQTKVVWKNIIVNQVYEFSGGIPAPPRTAYDWAHYPLNQTIRVVDKVHLPTVSSFDPYYEFSYNADNTTATDNGWGEVSGVRQPSGASAAYTYQYDSISGWVMDPVTLMDNGVVTKTLTYNLEYDGASTAHTDTWSYQRGGITNGKYGQITAPDGSVTKEYYRDIIAAANVYIKGEQFKTESPDGSVTEKIYATDSPGAPSNSNVPNPMLTANRYVKYEIFSIPGNSGTLSKTTFREYIKDKNGNLTEVKEYDYVATSSITIPRDSNGYATGLPSGISGSLKRITKTEYYNDTPEASADTYSDADSYHVSISPRLLGLVKSAEVKDASNNPKSRIEIIYDFTTYSSNTKAGNVTESRTWDSTKQQTLQSANSNGYKLVSANYVNTLATYDAYGNPTQTTDGNGVQTTLTYGAVGGFTGLYPTQTVTADGTAVARTSTAAYDFYTGLVTSATDVDNNLTNGTDYDDLGRPVKTKTAVGTALEAWTQTEYNDAERYVVVRSDLEAKGDGRKIAVQHYDQLGRVRLSRTIENPASENPYLETDGIKVQTRYMTSGGYTYQLTSNPYRAAYSSSATNDPTMGWTRSAAVNTGKHSEVETFSGAGLPFPWGNNNTSTGVVKTDTDADRTLVTDQAGKRRISQSNALGQLINVWEIQPADGETEAIAFNTSSGALSLSGLKTSYGYDTLSNLTTVNQGGQTRSFTYSSLSRLKSATNPESGLIQYNYDNNGNLTQKTDARAVVTSYVYDALNRVTNRNYSAPANLPNYQATSNVTYTYDNLPNAKGKLTKVESGSFRTEYQSFDILGRVTQSQQFVDGTSYGVPMTYTYNLSGALIEERYPSGRVVKNVLDNNGDLSMVQSKKNQNAGFWNYASNFTYTAAGAVSSMQLGNGRWESTAFNSRLQPTQIALGNIQNATNLLKLNYDYGTTDNNGNVKSQTITVQKSNQSPLVLTQSYVYDSLNRLRSAEEKDVANQTTWKQTYSFDRYGNRTFDQANTSYPNSFTNPNISNPQIDVSSNRFTTGQGYTYDAAGNLLTDAEGRTFTYDAENKQRSASNASGSLGTYFYDGDGKRVKKVTNSETVIFVYDALGKLVAEYSTQLSPTPQVQYLTNDNLGTPRINTDQNGAIVSRSDYLPYGEEIVGFGGRSSSEKYVSDDVRQGFTGYIKDDETGLDFAQARMYKKELGRFTSTDPLLTTGRPTNPKTWNRYIYTLNNPLNFSDPTGLYECSGTQKQCDKFAEGLKKANEQLAKIEKRYGSNSKEYTDAVRALKAYGTLGDKGVTVGFGKLKGNILGETGGTMVGKNGTGANTISVTIDLDKNKNDSDLLTTIAHEGSHVQDYSDYQGAKLAASLDATDPEGKVLAVEGGPLRVTHGQSETRAFGVSSVFAEFTMGGATSESAMTSSNGTVTFNLSQEPVKATNVGGEAIWKSSWQKLDVETVRKNRSAAIAKGLPKSDYAPVLNQPIQ